MSKIKLLVEIDEEDYGDFCDWFESVPSSVDGLPVVKGKFNTALYDAKPYNPSGDLISREALRKEVTEKVNFTTVDGHIAYDKMLKLIDNAPTVEEVSVIEFKEPLPMVKAQKIIKTLSNRLQGEWKTMEGYDGDEYYECSNCGEPWFLSAGTPKDNNMNFCPNCGADMRGGEENE